MALIDLIKNLDSYTKTNLLGPETTRILRLTFTENEFDALEDSIINEAILIQNGCELVQNESNRIKLLESLKKETINDLGLRSYEELKSRCLDLFSFSREFGIESKYLVEKPQENRNRFEIVRPTHNELRHISAYPHDYQRRLKNRLLTLLNNSTNQKILTSMPTGSGKTVLAMELIVDLIRSDINSKKSNILWIVSSKELAEQSFQALKKLWGQKGDQPVCCQRFFGEFNSLTSVDYPTITFATFDLLVSRLETDYIKSLLVSTSYLFIDEAHQSEAFTYEKVLLKYQRTNPQYKIIGLTATPFRPYDSEFNHFKQNFNLFEQLSDQLGKYLPSPIQYLIDHSFLSQINFNLLNNSEGNVSEAEYYQTLNNAVMNECKRIIERKENTIIFAKSKSHAVALSIFLKINGIENGLIIGETPDVVRKQLLQDFTNKENNLNILVNHLILSTGIDVPGMNSIMILGEINSPSLGLQIIGRAMRGPKNGGNNENTIYLTHQNYNRLSEFKLLENIVLN
jgi:superfamily II DNA or RNA helicase